jgi:hypothetical protein
MSMAKASAKSSAKATPTPETADAPPARDAAPAKDNRGRELLELRIRLKIINETVEARIAERKRLREAIDGLTKEMKQAKIEE